MVFSTKMQQGFTAWRYSLFYAKKALPVRGDSGSCQSSNWEAPGTYRFITAIYNYMIT